MGDILSLGREAIFIFLKISSPIIIVGMLVGLIVSLVQALTQIQEITLSFVPKVIAILIVLLISLPFIGNNMMQFSKEIMITISNIR